MDAIIIYTYKTIAVIKALLIECLNDNVKFISLTLAIFLLSIAFFAILYWLIFRFSLVSYKIIEGNVVTGFDSPMPSMVVNSSLLTRKIIKAKNDLLLSDFMGETINHRWHIFSLTKIDRSSWSSAEQEKWRVFDKQISSEQIPTDIVEKKFSEHENVFIERERISLGISADTHVHLTLKILGIPLEELNRRLSNNQQYEIDVLNISKTIVDEIERVISSGNRISLQILRSELMNIVRAHEQAITDKKSLAEGVYSIALSALASNNPSTGKFDLTGLKDQPTIFDFLYFSLLLGTSNTSDVLIPISTTARLLVWLQILWSYIILSLFIGMFVDVFKSLRS
ncbi:MAG: hypothetical protein HQK52_09425 [Oligoflexia bacterium]|nr:hypothetical protein [Oligoflexia bacterium]